MGNYRIKSTLRLPISLDEAWTFFSSPRNLSKITPAKMNFQILSNSESETMYAGQIITYNVSPVFNIPLYWMTEITHVQHHEYFIDEQRFGPYALWHHTHKFKAIDGGVEMTDIVHYKLPLGILGNFAHWLFVEKEVEQIFTHRTEILKNLFSELK